MNYRVFAHGDNTQLDDANHGSLTSWAPVLILIASLGLGVALPAEAAGHGRHAHQMQAFDRRSDRLNRSEIKDFKRSLSIGIGRSTPTGSGVMNHDHARHRSNSVGSESSTRGRDIRVQSRILSPSQSISQLDSGRIIPLENGVDLDLGSEDKNIVLGANLFGGADSVTIRIDGTEKVLRSGAHVTAAEYVAAKQVLSGSAQGLVLDNSGRAVGGQVDLVAVTDRDDRLKANSLVNPEGVTIYGDFGRRSDFSLHGDLTNLGNLYAYSSSSQRLGGSIKADNLVNGDGALISSALSTSQASLLGASTSPIDLNLHAVHDFSNSGQIESSGNLTITAGNSIKNTGESATPKITAVKSVNLVSPSVLNHGEITSTTGDVTFDSASVLNVNNSNGTIAARNGAINVRSSAYDGAFDSNLIGGNLFSNQLNLNAGHGLTTVDVGQITGSVNQHGEAVHLKASTDDLVIGDVCLAGDPTFYNTTGNITIAGDINVAEALTIVAAGNITLQTNVDLNAKSSVTNNGFPITLIAGANIIGTAGGADQTSLGPIPPNNPNNGGVTLDGTASATGGSIILQSQSVISAGVFSNSDPGNGGDLLLVALRGATAGTGKIDMQGDNRVESFGTGFGDNGNVTIIADGITGHNINGIFASSIDTRAASTIAITIATPAKSTSANIAYLANGSLAPGSSTFVAGSTLINSDVNVNPSVFGGIDGLNSDVIIKTDGAIAVNNIEISAVNVSLTAGTAITNSGQVIASNFLDASARDIGVSTSGGGFFGGKQVVLQSLNGSIGTSSANRVKTSASALALTTGGSVFVDEADDLIIGSIDSSRSNFGISSAGGAFDVLAHGNLTTNRAISNTTGDIRLATTGGLLDLRTIASGQQITANNGNVFIENTGVNKKQDKLNIATNVSAFGAAGLGNVTFTLGTAPPVPVKGKQPKGNLTVIQTPGVDEVFFGKGFTITDNGGGTLQAKGADIIFNNSLSKKNITLEGAQFILADPPSTSAQVVTRGEPRARSEMPFGGTIQNGAGFSGTVAHSPLAPELVSFLDSPIDSSRTVLTSELRLRKKIVESRD